MGTHPALDKLQAELNFIGHPIPELLNRAVVDEGKVISLNLDELELGNLPHFPIAISAFEDLEFLSLRYNNLTKLSDSLTSLSNLKTLNLSYNHIQSIPSNITKLRKLEMLDISKNRLDHIAQLPSSAKMINVSDNNLDHIPRPIQECTLLQHLNLSINHIQHIDPLIIMKLKGLKFLNLRSNFLASIPMEIYEHSSLEKVNLYNNPIKKHHLLDNSSHVRLFVDHSQKIESLNARVLKPSVYDVRFSPSYPPQFGYISVMMFGAASTGKHSLLQRYINHVYLPERSLAIPQNRYLAWDHYIMEDKNRIFQFWYPNTQDHRNENYRQGILNGFYYTSIVCLLYDVTEVDSFRVVLESVRRIHEIRYHSCPIFIVGNKVDMGKRFASMEVILQIIEQLREHLNVDVQYFEVSAMDGTGVKELFEAIYQTHI